MKVKEENINVWLPLALSLMLAAGMLFGYKMNDKDESPLISAVGDLSEFAAPIGQIEELIRFVETKYVDSVDRGELVSSAIEAVLQKLDPHSVYISPDQLTRINQEMNGSFTGIGMESFYLNDTVNIIRVIEGSPAERAGLERFDRIIAIGDSIVAGQGLAFADIEAMLKGDVGAKVALSILDRAGVEKKATVTIGDIPLVSVDVATNITDDIGYVKLNRFSSTTYKEFMDYFEDMYESGTKHMIIDLRGNPGGYLPQATNILSQLFTQQGNLLVYTEGRNDTKLDYKTTGKPFFKVDKISVLIDEGSASGSEIIAGAIQEWDRGVIIGRRSFGKGLVQEQYPLGNGGAIRLTVARYYTPTGRSIQKTYDDLDSYEDDIYDRIHAGELFSADSAVVDTGIGHKTMLLERSVQGGGGITPDVFVPIDSLELSYDYVQMINQAARQVFTYVRNHPDTDYTDEIGRNILTQYLDSDSIQITTPITESIKARLLKDIQYDFIRYANGEEQMYKAKLLDDPFISLSIKYIENDIPLDEL